jgi:glutathione synthetase
MADGSFLRRSVECPCRDRYLLERHCPERAVPLSQLPPNRPIHVIAAALAQAVKLHELCGAADVVMMVVQPGDRNSTDQRWIEYTLWNAHRVRMIRRSLADVAARGTLGSDAVLRIDGERVAVAYYRAGYTPNDYPTEAEWTARLLIERASAIKCPSIAYHLAGTKKLQQALAAPGIVERYLPAEQAQQVRSCFAGLWSLDDSTECQAIIQQALASPHNYVLKPQREGGGNNFYNDELKVSGRHV